MSGTSLNQIESDFVSYFSDAVKVFGLPKSVGEIYGLLYASPEALSMNDLIEKLSMSKGSASQGLKILRTINAVVEVSEGRKSLYSANIELKSLIGGILHEQIQPLLNSTKDKVKDLSTLASEETNPEAKKFYQSPHIKTRYMAPQRRLCHSYYLTYSWQRRLRTTNSLICFRMSLLPKAHVHLEKQDHPDQGTG